MSASTTATRWSTCLPARCRRSRSTSPGYPLTSTTASDVSPATVDEAASFAAGSDNAESAQGDSEEFVQAAQYKLEYPFERINPRFQFAGRDLLNAALGIDFYILLHTEQCLTKYDCSGG